MTGMAQTAAAVSTSIRPVEQFRGFPRTEVDRAVGAWLRRRIFR